MPKDCTTFLEYWKSYKEDALANDETIYDILTFIAGGLSACNLIQNLGMTADEVKDEMEAIVASLKAPDDINPENN